MPHDDALTRRHISRRAARAARHGRPRALGAARAAVAGARAGSWHCRGAVSGDLGMGARRGQDAADRAPGRRATRRRAADGGRQSVRTPQLARARATGRSRRPSARALDDRPRAWRTRRRVPTGHRPDARRGRAPEAGRPARGVSAARSQTRADDGVLRRGYRGHRVHQSQPVAAAGTRLEPVDHDRPRASPACAAPRGQYPAQRFGGIGCAAATLEQGRKNGGCAEQRTGCRAERAPGSRRAGPADERGRRSDRRGIGRHRQRTGVRSDHPVTG